MRDVNPQSQLVMVELLRSIYAGLHVQTLFTRDVPDEVVIVQRTGGQLANSVTDAAAFAIQCYAPDQARAEQLATTLWHALYRQNWAGLKIRGHMVRGWESYGAPQLFLDPDRPNKVRFQFSGRLWISTLQAQ